MWCTSCFRCKAVCPTGAIKYKKRWFWSFVSVQIWFDEVYWYFETLWLCFSEYKLFKYWLPFNEYNTTNMLFQY
jgi:ferredoxin